MPFSARWPNYPKTTEIYLGIAGADLHPISDDAVIRSNYRRSSDRLQYIGWMTNVEPAAGAVKLGRRLAAPKEWPFMLLNNSGSGRSVYFAADIAQAYFIAPYQYQRRLISDRQIGQQCARLARWREIERLAAVADRERAQHAEMKRRADLIRPSRHDHSSGPIFPIWCAALGIAVRAAHGSGVRQQGAVYAEGALGRALYA